MLLVTGFYGHTGVKEGMRGRGLDLREWEGIGVLDRAMLSGSLLGNVPCFPCCWPLGT